MGRHIHTIIMNGPAFLTARSKLKKVPHKPDYTVNTERENVASIPADKQFKLSGVLESSNSAYDFCWIKGRRPTMEDSHLAYHSKKLDLDILAVFDGHAGDAVAKRVVELLPKTFETVMYDHVTMTEMPIEQIIKIVFVTCDKLFLKYLSPAETASGATAAVVIRYQGMTYAAHIGDSRIMFFDKSDNLLYNSEDHKFTNPSEKTRIEKAGGYVAYGRITLPKSYGGLAVARAFGDFQYKKLNHEDTNPASVSVEPDISAFKSDDIGGILIMCDGVTDALDDDIIVQRYKDRRLPQNLASELVMEAFKNGSLDNISTCYVRPGIKSPTVDIETE